MMLRIYKQALELFTHIAAEFVNCNCARQYSRFRVSHMLHNSCDDTDGNKVFLSNLCDCFHIAKTAEHMKTQTVGLAFIAA